MDFFTFVSLMLEDPRPWILAGFTILGPAIAFFVFLWFFRVNRLIIKKSVSCPEQRRLATVELITHIGELGPYRDVRFCSLQQGGKEATCRKGCLNSFTVQEAPFISIQREKG